MRGSLRYRVAGAALASALAVTMLTSCAEEPENAGGKGGKSITVGLTYTPNIQFAPFYVASEKGFYKDAGINVTLRHHGAAEDLFGALKRGKEDVIYAGGDEMLQARAKGDLPLVDIATFYQKYPVGLIVPESSEIREVSDLKGRTLGTPGPYGETYFGLLALLKEAGLSAKDAKVKYIGFTQQAALTGNKVQGVMGYLNNDAIAFKEAGKPVRSITLNEGDTGDPLVGVGLGATEKTLKKRDADLKKFVDASLRGLQFAIENPEETVKLSKKFVPGLTDAKRKANALAVLKATTPMMENKHGALGENDPQTWTRMADFMYSQGLLEKSVTPEQAYSNDYLPKS